MGVEWVHAAQSHNRLGRRMNSRVEKQYHGQGTAGGCQALSGRVREGPAGRIATRVAAQADSKRGPSERKGGPTGPAANSLLRRLIHPRARQRVRPVLISISGLISHCQSDHADRGRPRRVRRLTGRCRSGTWRSRPMPTGSSGSCPCTCRTSRTGSCTGRWRGPGPA
jgi:hypothetical protein